jgi:hypothetical protein
MNDEFLASLVDNQMSCMADADIMQLLNNELAQADPTARGRQFLKEVRPVIPCTTE